VSGLIKEIGRALFALEKKDTGRIAIVVALLMLLVGTFMRTASLRLVSNMLHPDEAWHGIDALELIAHPRFVAFIPHNFGRESGWVYWRLCNNSSVK